MRITTIVATLATLFIAQPMTATTTADNEHNPFLQPYTTQYSIPPFEQIRNEHYMPAILAGLEQLRTEVNAIADNPAQPTFDNTILAMEQSGSLLHRVMAVFSALNETDASPETEAIAAEALPMVSLAQDEISMNPRLFERVRSLYQRRDSLGLTGPQRRAVEESYRSFVRGGALLSPAAQDSLKAVNTRMTELYLTFNRNLLSATNDWSAVIDDAADLAGLPASSVAMAADEAASRGLQGKWVFTLQAPSRLPVLQYADNRDLRRRVYQGYMNLASQAPYDNRPVINEILRQRTIKARLLGYKDYASYATADVMAHNPDNAEDLLLKIFRPAVNKVAQEVSEMQAVADAEGLGAPIEPWDYYYYAEKVRRNKYSLDEDQVRQYFPLEQVRKGIFGMAERLYNIKFVEMPDAPKYHPEVRVYDVRDASTDEHIAVFMTDYFPRASKRQGAWMDALEGGFLDPDGTSQRPIVFNVGNFTRPAGDVPSLLTVDEVETMFHEFGHALHGMLTRAQLRSQAGTAVDRDFVELPSQIHEHWAFEPEMLKFYAHHYRTGEAMPDSLIQRLQAASTHNQGFMTTELAGASLLDLYWGKLNLEQSDSVDVDDFERQVADKIGMPALIQYRYRSPYFRHIFGSDGYASGYYTYLWAQVLDCDGFELFSEKGIFDPETAASFRHNVLEAGGSEDPMVLYVRFRGHEPSVDALLRFRGLTEPKDDTLHQPGGK